MATFSVLSLCVIAATVAVADAANPVSSPEDAVFYPGRAMYDSTGERMYAGGANIFLENGVYWLVGEGKKVLSGVCSECFNLYSSTDLATWTNRGCVLKNEDIVAPGPKPSQNYRMERPKIFRCPTGDKGLRLWFHCDTINFSMRSVGVLTAPAVEGPWTFASPCFRPDGRDSYDMGTYVDDAAAGGDGHAYLIRSVENHFAGISQMSDDCLGVTGIVSQGPDMEGQAIMRDSEGILHALGSHLTGWAPNAAQFVSSPNATLPGAQWLDNINPSNDATTYDSQSTFIFPYKHADGHTTFIYMGDRWNSGNPGPSGIDNMTMIWLPLIPPSASPAPPSLVGAPLIVNTCNASDSLQSWAITGGVMRHTPSGLCVDASGGSSQQPLLAACEPARNSQRWAMTARGSVEGGSPCLALNVMDDRVHVPGDVVIAFACQSPPSWNEIWINETSGALRARDKAGAPSALCLAAQASNSGPQWTLPWHDSWSLKDF